MKHRWIVVYAASLLVGLGVSRLAPARWGLETSHVLLIGSALYFGALHRFVMRGPARTEAARWSRQDGLLLGLLTRTVVFLALAALQAMACFEWAPHADLRAGYVIAATWLLALGLIDPPSWARERRLGAATSID